MKTPKNNIWFSLGSWGLLWSVDEEKRVWGKKKCCFAGIPSGDLEDFVLEKTLYSGLQLKWKEIHKEG